MERAIFSLVSQLCRDGKGSNQGSDASSQRAPAYTPVSYHCPRVEEQRQAFLAHNDDSAPDHYDNNDAQSVAAVDNLQIDQELGQLQVALGDLDHWFDDLNGDHEEVEPPPSPTVQSQVLDETNAIEE